MILEVTNNVAEMGNGDRNAISKVLMVRMADMLDRLMGDNRVRLETPQEVFDAVHKTANLLKSSSPESDQS